MIPKWAYYFFFIATGLFGVFTILRILFQFHLFDFAIYYRSVEDIKHGISMYRDTSIAMKYPMTSILVLYPIGWLPYQIAEKLWTFLSLAGLGISLLLMKQSLSEISAKYWLLILSLIVLSFPYKFTLGMGQINLIILATMCGSIYAYLKGYKILAGGLISVAAWIKITPLILLLYFVRKREYKIVLASVAIYVFGWVMAGQFWGYHFVKEFFTEVASTISTLGNNVYYNQAFTGLLSRLNINDSISGLINYLLLAIMLLASFISTPIKKVNHRVEITAFGMFIMTMLLSAGLAWQHHFVWSLLPFLGVASILIHEKKTGKIVWVWFFVAYFLISFNIKNPEVFIGWSKILLSHVTYGGVILWTLCYRALKIKET